MSSQYIEIHVIGAERGESIVVRFPSNGSDKAQWGVIDCYAHDPEDEATNLTFQFLRKHRVRELAFLCLTHPHDDHYTGMSHLCRRFRIREFWMFNSNISPDDLLFTLENQAHTQAEKRKVRDLEQTLEFISKSTMPIRHLEAGQTFMDHRYSVDEVTSISLKIHILAPAGRAVVRYDSKIKQWFQQVAQTPVGQTPNRPELNHNSISGALLLVYGDTHILLGGDVETANWRNALKQNPCSHWLQPGTHAVKVSHHGSNNGYCPGLWRVFHRHGQREPYAVITPFKQQGLPTQKTLNHIREHTPHIMTTSRSSLPLYLPSEDYLPFIETITTHFPEFRVATNGGKAGICSLRFDAQGNCIHEALQGDAGRI